MYLFVPMDSFGRAGARENVIFGPAGIILAEISNSAVIFTSPAKVKYF